MATLKKYNLSGKDTGEASIEDNLLTVSANSQLIKDYLVAKRKNARQWSASTQTRAEVSHSKKKPFAQKGTGNARQGFLGSPQFRGGGRVHAPRPKFEQHVRINKKERRMAIRHLLGEKVKANHVRILDDKPLDAPKTKLLSQFLKAIQLSGKRVLFVADGEQTNLHNALYKSLRNIPKAEFCYLKNVNGESLALSQELVVLDSALGELISTLGGKS